MEIKIKSIGISYFKGIKVWSAKFNDGIVEISGNNGSGKTTIADAIWWCLFGKNATGDTKFSIKTLDTDGNVIPNVEHSVTLTLDIDGKEVSIKRVWIEGKVTSRGRATDEIKHHAEFFVNGEKFLKKDFDTYMESIITEQQFKAVTSPTFFMSLKWQEQREMLANIVGSVDTGPVDNDAKYTDVLDGIKQHETLENYLKHLYYNIKEVKSNLEKIPPRIDEQRISLPQEVDYARLEEGIKDISRDIDEKNAILAGLQGDNNAKDNILLRKKEFAQKRLENMRISAQNMANEANGERIMEYQRATKMLLEARKNNDDIKAKLNAYKIYIERAEMGLKEVDDEVEAFRAEWSNNEQKVYNDDINTICPVCQQELPPDKIESMRESNKAKFNAKKAETRERLREKALQIKQKKADIEKQLKEYQKEMDAIKIDEYVDKIAELEKSVDELSKRKTVDASDLLLDKPEYNDVLKEIEEIDYMLNHKTDTDTGNGDIKAVKSELDVLMSNKATMEAIIAKREVYEQGMARIAELEGQQSALNNQLDALMFKEDIAREYEQECNELLESAVNQMFTKVKFRLFETLNDGTKKPNCVAWVETSQGLVPYNDANAAMKINAGRDIINTLSKHYNLYAPCVTDNAESTIELLPILGQDFRFYVTQDNILRINN